ncbi:MAG TPA: transcription elongation factor GreA [Nocardioidaceae bacterium]|nr:transcription elongation factor GreA [Nocardioidaceae bacterium]
MTQPSEQREQDLIWLTEKAYSALQEQLAGLRSESRSDVVAKISAAREEGDLRENGGYHAAREEQGKLESQIRQLEDLLRGADTTPAADDGVVKPGMVVSTRFAGDDDVETFLLGAREMDDFTGDLTVYSPQSPLGTALLGAKRSDTVAYTAPTGRQLKVEIVDAVPYTG